ncbi:hypothetical protein [Telmatospirillum siberiense]|uniref:Uncharacterized protein n=1 Tax=Telmatospirillum siberiense TaxID=382514 RepID=A0A2N3PSN9_9PROT|nr:hypothetical protein [Telmatospirillum siberiense]PKU23419.1 hypothetical protein CWS72_16290 [Telmatospirillum siberiense]
MDSYRLCWQATPGGRTECTAPISRDIALFRLREQATSFPAIQSWIVEEATADRAEEDGGE